MDGGRLAPTRSPVSGSSPQVMWETGLRGIAKKVTSHPAAGLEMDWDREGGWCNIGLFLLP